MRNNKRVNSDEIRRQTRKIVEKFHPSKIILFGSYAYGRPNSDSDVDLLIIMKTRNSPAKQASEVWKTLWPSPFPADIIVRTPSDVRRRLAWGDFFIEEIMEKGQVLYEK